ncbi:molybdopterin-dependent oxidoreductase [Nocardioides ferulae]|uniref:molybdopterin-dependent oxidoreductase n=1 Tax=Nocardioides ferulae TaxID=2340821 RepID=UPI000EAB83E7|nr:molybdopterin-dependent oxidoreductase [Nocardioides ferulae]
MGETRIGCCNLCEAICGLVLTVEDNRVTRVQGNPDDPLSRGHLCPKGVALADIAADPERLVRPVRRHGSGADATWEELDWDEALDLVAARLAATINEHGRDAVATYLGNPSAHSPGMLTHGTAFLRALRTRSRFSASSVDQLPAQLVAHLMFGHQLLLPIPDLDRTSFLLVLGANPMASNGSLMTAPDLPNRLRALRARGGRLVVLDPRRTETAKVADEHHHVVPGSDGWAVLAMVRQLFLDGLVRAPDYVDGLDEVRRAVKPFTVEEAERRTGIPAETLVRLTHEMAEADGAVAYGRIGVSTHPWGTVTLWGVQLLNLLTGNLDRVGGAMFTSPAVDLIGTLAGPGSHGRWRSRVRGLPESAGELPAAALREEIETPGDGQVRALVTVAGNPVLSTPDGSALGRALDGLDFMVAIDLYLNETTRHADVVLPTTTALERDQFDLVLPAFAVHNTARFSPPVIEPHPDARHDWQVFAELARRLQPLLDDPVPDARWAALETQLSASPREALALLLDAGGSGVTLPQLLDQPSGIDLGPLRPDQLPDRLRTPGHRVDAAPGLVLDDLDRMLATSAAPPPGQLLLIGRRHQRDNNSWMHNYPRLVRGRPRHRLLMHPDDLAERGLVDGTAVDVASAVGTVTVEVEASDDMMPGVVCLPHGYGHAAHGSPLTTASALPGVSVNDLTDPARLDVSGNAAFTGLPVTVTASVRDAAGAQGARETPGPPSLSHAANAAG